MAANAADTGVAVLFRVSYPTAWGQRVVVIGAGPALGDWDPAAGVALGCRPLSAALVWEGAATVPASSTPLRYKYAVLDEGGAVVDVEAAARRLPLDGARAGDTALAADTWTLAGHPTALLAKAAFRDAMLPPRPPVVGGAPPAVPRAPRGSDGTPTAVVLRFAVRALGLRAGDHIVVLGSAPTLGSWRAGKGLALAETDTPLWEGATAVPPSHFPVTYRFAIARGDDPDGDDPELEAGENRIAAFEAGGISADGGAPPTPPALVAADAGWLRPGAPWRGAGLAVPLFSVRSEAGLGVGGFPDLAPLARWCAAAGLRAIQILPVNDTRVSGDWTDSYPYSAVSVFALHPIYLGVEELMDHAPCAAPLPPAAAAALTRLRTELNPLPALDYEAVLAAKLEAARAIYEDGGGREAAENDPAYSSFLADNAAWLRPYAAHRALTAVFGHARHGEWGSLARATDDDVDRVLDPAAPGHAAGPGFECWLQWHAHKQLLAASQAAASLGVALKGDLPIGVDPHSADAWRHPHLFRAGTSTGAPPDAFDARGQAWGFPTYDWGAAARDSYRWWASRLRHMARYFSALRLDHVLAFFRVWELDAGAVTGLCGRFRPARPYSKPDLDAAGMWDVNRLADPHVTRDYAAAALAGAGADALERYTRPGDGGRLRLADAGATEAGVDALAAPDGAPPWVVAEIEAAKEGLLALVQNVCLVRDVDAPDAAFHPRFRLADSESFASLPDDTWKRTLAAWHDEYFHGGRHDAAWTTAAAARLPPLLAATDMLVCGEDLGMVPTCLPAALERLGVLGLRVERMPAPDAGAGAEFGDPGAYPYLTVASPSTHDVVPLRAWWEADPSRAARYWEKVRGGEGWRGGWLCRPRALLRPLCRVHGVAHRPLPTPQVLHCKPPCPAACTPAAAAAVLASHARSPSMLAMFPLQDILALSPTAAARPAGEEAVNDPTVRRHYWRYRSHIPIEALHADVELTASVRGMLADAGRDVGGGE